MRGRRNAPVDFYCANVVRSAWREPETTSRLEDLCHILMVDSMDHLLTDPATNAEAQGGRTVPVGN
jgi:hypothetical protein